MYKLIVSELAHQDLDHIISYIAINLVNPIAATNFLDEIEKCYARLKDNPFLYGKCYDLRLEMKEYRKAIIKHYVLIYRVDEPEKTVKVLRFFYGAQDYAELI